MTAFTYKKNTLHADDVSLSQLAEKYGTPLYVYSETAIVDAFAAYDDAMSKVTARNNYTICYASKANSNVAVLTALRKRGAGADIVSGGEMARALAAGIPPSKIVYSGVGKSEEELTQAIRHGIFQINVESAPELEMISKIAVRLKKRVSVSIRVNPNVDAKTHAKITTGKKENKFGIDIDQAPKLYARAAKLKNIDAIGVAVHIGSQLTSLEPYRRAYTRVAQLVALLRKKGHAIQRVDLGGGIGITYKNETPPDLYLYALMVRDIILTLGVHVILEPGRSIVGNAGVLLSRVVQVKEGGHKRFLILDAAMNDLIRPALYDAYHAVTPVAKKSGRKKKYDVVGPVCETGDTFIRDLDLPELAAGDLVALMSAGAYGAVMSSNYNTRPLAGEVMVSGTRHAAIRKKQTVDDLINQDVVPAWV
jgi:diaminopimelate decarboxylase